MQYIVKKIKYRDYKVLLLKYIINNNYLFIKLLFLLICLFNLLY